MTRKEYEQKYGVAPVFSSTSSIDTTPAPRIMTREEYQSEFFPKNKNIVQKAGSMIKDSFNAGVEKTKAGFDKAQGASNTGSVKDLYRGSLRLASGAIETAFAPLAPLFYPISNRMQKTSEAISDIPLIQKIASGDKGQKLINTVEDVYDIANIAGTVTGSRGASKLKPIEAIDNFKKTRQVQIANKIEKELFDIENSYTKTSKQNSYLKDGGSASRKRIAQTDVLTNLVDEDGKITVDSAKRASDIYQEQKIGGAEGVVRDLLKNEGKKVSLDQVQKILTNKVATAGLEGGDLIRAMNGIKQELQGLKLRADKTGNIPLDKIHDTKISTTRNIDYTKPPEVSYRKAIANAYKEIVEDNSKTKISLGGKEFNIKDINERLGEVYGDVERIASLGGKRVKGGRLGKYSSQIAGNLAGATAGGVVGGPIGMAIGTIVGGEVASKLRGKQMSSTFGKARGKIIPKDSLIEAGKMSIPDKKVTAIKSVVKNKEIIKLEKEISKNVDQQKKAIKAGDFTLVKALKEVYVALVETLKEAVKKFKALPKNRGFIKNPFSDSSKVGKQLGKEKVKPTASSNTTGMDKLSQQDSALLDKLTERQKEAFANGTPQEKQIALEHLRLKDNIEKNLAIPKKVNTLEQEAKKYKSAEEFVKAQGETVYHGTGESVKFDKFDISKAQNGNRGKEIYLTENKVAADWFSRLKSQSNFMKTEEFRNGIGNGAIGDFKPNTMEIVIPRNAKIKVLDKLPQGDSASIISQLKKEGYDGVRFTDDVLNNIEGQIGLNEAFVNGKHPDTTLIFNPDILKTKSQLTDIWNKANNGNKIHPEDISVMEDFIDSVRIKKEIPEARFNMAEKLAEKFDISMDKGLAQVANQFEDVLSGKKKVKPTLLK